MSVRTLQQWLQYQEQIHPNSIELGLDRVQQVWRRIQQSQGSISCPVIVVGGTNGKGSTVAFLEQIYIACGYRTLAYSSPHVLAYNERIRLNGLNTEDALLVEAFEQVEAARGEVSLTYFEFGTLAALFIALVKAPQVLILEVGLGGRLDATNILQHDVAVITSISTDHIEWLGENLSEIAVEKAGIARADRPFIIGDSNVPRTLFDQAELVGAQVLSVGQDYEIDPHHHDWDYKSASMRYRALPRPVMAGGHQLNNAASAITAAGCLMESLPVNEQAITAALRKTVLPGRFEQVSTSPAVYLDVAHNEAAARELHDMLQDLKGEGKLIAVLAMQSTRQPDSLTGPLQTDFSQWHLAPLANGSGHKADFLASSVLSRVPEVPVKTYSNLTFALRDAISQAREPDTVVVFGSFHTVAEAKAAMHV